MLLQGHVFISASMALVLAAAGLLLRLTGSASIGSAVLGLGGALPFVLLLWLLRRAFYVQFVPQYAALGGAIYALMMVAALAGLEHAGWLSATTALLGTGASSLPVSVLLYVLLRRHVTRSESPSGQQEERADGHGGRAPNVIEARAVLRDHSSYAKWAAPAALTLWLAAYAHYFALSSAARLDQVAAMRALDTLIAPYWLYLGALTGILLPVFSRRIAQSTEGFAPFTLKILGVFLAQALVVWAALSLLAGPLLSLLYPGKYSGYAHYFPLMSLMLVPETLSLVLLAACRSLVRTDLVFLYNATLAVSLLIGFLIAAHWGIWGIVIVRLAVSFSLLIGFFRVVYPTLSVGPGGSSAEVEHC
jgi:O-antigen/teichoic acid export membrane protein